MYRYSQLAVTLLLCSFLFSCEEPKSSQKNTEQPSNTGSTILTKNIPYKLVNKYPHSTQAFTEGLEYVDGYIYESTGQYGKSYISKNELETGKQVDIYRLEDKYFGEGMTVLNDKVYMLTYKAKLGFVFDKKTLKLLNTFPLKTNEGWGMTNDGTNLIYGDGSSYIYYIDPNTYNEVKRLEVMDKYGSVSAINEMEYINGYIYANQWNTNYIVKIDPSTGQVVGQADLSNLRRQTGIPEPQYGNEEAPEVLNGIAYDADNNRVYITGKNWPYIFEIKLDN